MVANNHAVWDRRDERLIGSPVRANLFPPDSQDAIAVAGRGTLPSPAPPIPDDRPLNARLEGFARARH